MIISRIYSLCFYLISVSSWRRPNTLNARLRIGSTPTILSLGKNKKIRLTRWLIHAAFFYFNRCVLRRQCWNTNRNIKGCYTFSNEGPLLETLDLAFHAYIGTTSTFYISVKVLLVLIKRHHFLPRITAELALDPDFEKWMLRPVYEKA